MMLAARLTAALVVATLVACSPLLAPVGLRRFALEDLVPLRSDLFPLRRIGKWVSDTEYLYMAEDGIRSYNAADNSTSIFLTEDVVKNLNHTISSYSKNGRFLLLASNTRKVFRWSSTAKYYVYEVESGSTFPVGRGQHIQTCVWSGGSRPALAYVRENNVYYVADVADAGSALQLTDDGRVGEIYNGVADWIYEEEILNSANAMWFSSEGSYLAVATFNDTLVESATYQYYGNPTQLDYQYPVMVHFKYPKAGRTNPTVRLRVFSLDGDEKPATSIPAPAHLVGADHILGSVKWASDRHLVVLWLNRRQNTSVLMRCDMETDKCETERIHNEPNGWIDISDATFDGTGNRMVDVSPQPAGDDRYPHAVLTDFAANTSLDLSPGNVTVLSVLGWDFESDSVYYLATTREVPWERQMWVSAAAAGGGARCVTCGEGACRTVAAEFAPGAAHALLTCSATNTPPRNYMYNARSGQLTLWADNSELAATLSGYALPRAVDSVLRLQPGVVAHARLLLPPDLDPAAPRKHPMVLKVYAGPGTSRVLDRYELDYSTYLATNRSFVVCYVDVRGSGAMGTRALHAVNNALGTVEVDDTLQAIRHLVSKYSFIDGSRVGVWGWSYGGYTAALMLAHDSERLLRCAAAIAPVTSWIYYDSIYTERYMGVPGDNPLGYQRSELLLQAGRLRGHRLLLVHGNADDNVHYQHSTMLSKLLQHADIDFEQMSYPDENHSLSGVSRHFYHKLDHYWSECFK